MKKMYESPVFSTVTFEECVIMTVSYGDNFGGLLPGWGTPSGSNLN